MENIRPRFYPHMLIITSFHDNNIPYWDAAKYIGN